MFSKTCEYGIRAVIYISARGSQENKVGITEISRNIEAPSHFTAKILQTLVRSSIVSSQKGVNGGFYVNKSQRQIQLATIVRAIDGDLLFSGCGLGLSKCSDTEPCPLHDNFKEIRSNLRRMMEETTVDDMATSLINGRGFIRVNELVPA